MINSLLFVVLLYHCLKFLNRLVFIKLYSQNIGVKLMGVELEPLESNKTWSIVSLPPKNVLLDVSGGIR